MQLTGCSCAGAQVGEGSCAGARPQGLNSNTCSARSASDKPVIAHAVCAWLRKAATVPLPAMEHFDYTDPSPIHVMTSQEHFDPSSDIEAFPPVQSVYCSTGCEK